MSTFTLKKLESVEGYYKLEVNGQCYYDEFENTLVAGKQKEKIKSLTKIFRYMERKRDGHQLTLKQYEILKPVDVQIPEYEFKGDDIRIYGIEIISNEVIIIGGFKKNQTKDIKDIRRIKELFVEFLQTIDSIESIKK